MDVGIHSKLSMQQYLSLRALSSGLCNTILQQSPHHAKRQQDEPTDDPSTESDIGTIIHDALLEGVDRIAAIDPELHRSKPNKANPEGAIPKGWTNNAIRSARDAARAEGKLPMLAGQVAHVLAAVEAAKAFIDSSELAGLFDNGAPEQTLIWMDEGVRCKARPDWLSEDRSILCHVKTTTGSAQPDSWIKNQMINNGYDVAAMFYERGLYALPGDGADAPTSVFLVIEQQPPFGCSLIGLSPMLADLASRKVERAIKTWARCQQSGRYPCYPTRICYADPRPWDLQQEEERSMFSEQELQGGIPL